MIKQLIKIYIKDSYINSLNTYTLKKCGKVHCENVTFNINGKEEFIENKDLSLDI